jgi:hypothetical protein
VLDAFDAAAVTMFLQHGLLAGTPQLGHFRWSLSMCGLRSAARFATMLAGLCGLASSLGAQVIDTRIHIPVLPGGLPIGASGSANPGLIGQTFIAPLGFPVLETFSMFLIRWHPVPGTIPDSNNDFDFVGTVQAFVGGAPVGPILFQSSPHRQPATHPLGLASEELFDTGGISLTPGATYLASVVPLETSPLGGRTVATVHGYADGTIYFSPPNPVLRNIIDTNDWDLAFVATFSAARVVPEPDPVWLLLSSGILLLLVRSVRQRRTR